ncbi:ice-binding family protein [Haliea sp. E1-2-M8]|uniref:ice-binding family protein n=1 Tax=Haliea sp. E1-2-M8 TaxID=3064706 RepID=UPI0027256224|nr:ice-binding family protein [Haliea sp. E1-2-M8]MDO8863127.1 ice-binding family protein [Haliea sp. E1-2-M8]
MSITHARFTTRKGIITSVGFAALVSLAYVGPAAAQAVAPPLGTAGGFAVLGTNELPTTGTATCTTSTIDGNVGSTGNSITDTGPCTITGDVVAPVTAAVVSDFDSAYAAVTTLNPVCTGVVPTTTTTLPPGVYCSPAGTTLGAGVTITLDGDADDVWVFRVGTGGLGALTGTGPNLQVVMGGTAQACNVYWWTAEGATMTNATFAGTVLAGTAAAMTGTSWEGRALATTDVTVTDSIISGCAASAPVPASAQPIPTLGPGTLAGLIVLLAGMGLFTLRRRFV